MSILKYLDLSTGHISRETCNDWARQEIYPVIGNYEYGLVVSVPDPDADWLELIPRDLLDVIIYARKHDCSLIRFDSDGDKLEELPYFNW